MPRRKGEPTRMLRVYADDADWMAENAEAHGVSVAEAFRRMRQRRGERPVMVDFSVVAPPGTGPTIELPPPTSCACETFRPSKVVTSLCTACGLVRRP